jgi:hypothetical protein
MIRIAAALLAVIGTLWCFAVFSMTFFPPRIVRIDIHHLIFAMTTAPGYLVTAGYFWRAAVPPAYQWRIAIWIASILFQGIWLLVFLGACQQDCARFLWFAACAVSMVVLPLESNDPQPAFSRASEARQIESEENLNPSLKRSCES